MLGWVGLVLKLLQDDTSWDAVAQFLGSTDCSRHAVLARSEAHLSTVCLNKVATLHTHGVGHGEDELVALHCTHQCQSHTRVSTGRLDDGCTRLEQTLSLCVLDHGEGDTILYTASRVEVFHLCDD